MIFHERKEHEIFALVLYETGIADGRSRRAGRMPLKKDFDIHMV